MMKVLIAEHACIRLISVLLSFYFPLCVNICFKQSSHSVYIARLSQCHEI